MDQQYAEEIELGIRMDAGAPMPRVLSDGGTVLVLCYLRDETIGLVTFTRVYNLLFGGLNDEALAGHPLWGRGLEHYAFHEVHHSAWIAECEQRNSVHYMHRGGWHARMRHYIATFHDQTLECLARDVRGEVLPEPTMSQALAVALARLQS